jgi:hypothetical protein
VDASAVCALPKRSAAASFDPGIRADVWHASER